MNYYEDDYVEKECSSCFEVTKKYSQVNELLQSIVNKLYGVEKVDLFRVESDLDELCYMFGVDIPQGDMQIQKKDKKLAFLKDWMEYSKDQLTIGGVA